MNNSLITECNLYIKSLNFRLCISSHQCSWCRLKHNGSTLTIPYCTAVLECSLGKEVHTGNTDDATKDPNKNIDNITEDEEFIFTLAIKIGIAAGALFLLFVLIGCCCWCKTGRGKPRSFVTPGHNHQRPADNANAQSQNLSFVTGSQGGYVNPAMAGFPTAREMSAGGHPSAPPDTMIESPPAYVDLYKNR